MRVLVVDDHTLLREVIIRMFDEQPDFEVVGQAGSVKDAIDLAVELNPDVVLLDLTLPDGSGLDALDAIVIRKPNIKVIILTIFELDEQAFSAFYRGAQGYLIKNIPFSHLLASLRALERGEIAASRGLISRFMGDVVSRKNLTYRQPSTSTLLSFREIEVLKHLSDGASNKEIASRLFIAENTVKIHVHNILHKLDLKDRLEAAHYAHQLGMAEVHADSKFLRNWLAMVPANADTMTGVD